MATPSPYLLDTNVVLSLLRRNALGRFLEVAYGLSPPGPDHQVSIVTVGELRSLAGQSGWGPVKLAALDALVGSITAHNVDDRFANAYAEIDTASHAVGHKMGKNDLWIAATARVLALTLLTTDKDFDHLRPTWIALEWVDPASKLTP
jgi:predicted nucleic acid-binding protein